MVGKCHNRWTSLSAGCRATTRSMTAESIIKAVPLSHGHFELTNRSKARRNGQKMINWLWPPPRPICKSSNWTCKFSVANFPVFGTRRTLEDHWPLIDQREIFSKIFQHTTRILFLSVANLWTNVRFFRSFLSFSAFPSTRRFRVFTVFWSLCELHLRYFLEWTSSYWQLAQVGHHDSDIMNHATAMATSKINLFEKLFEANFGELHW